jgi:hypothetical protein
MATDDTPPRTGLILRLAVLAIVTLFLVHAGLSAYFDSMARAEEQRKAGDIVPEALIALRTDEKARLTSGAMPIDKAMQTIAEKGRLGVSPALAPTASKDVAPLQGWSKMPGEVPPAMTAAPPPPAEPSVDGGLSAGDAGAAPAATRPDAGPSKAGPARPGHK